MPGCPLSGQMVGPKWALTAHDSRKPSDSHDRGAARAHKGLVGIGACNKIPSSVLPSPGRESMLARPSSQGLCLGRSLFL